MKIFLYAKIAAVTGIFISGTTLLIAQGFNYTKRLSKQPEHNVFIYAKNISSTITTRSDQTVDNNLKNLGCMINQALFECQLSILQDFDATTKQISTENLKTTKTDVVNKTHFTQNKNIYKIKAHIESWAWWKAGNKNMSIVDKKNTKQQYANLQIMFMVAHDYKLSRHTEIKHFVVQADKHNIPIKIHNMRPDDSQNKPNTLGFYKCEAIKKNNKNPVSCAIYPFSDYNTTKKEKELNKKTFKYKSRYSPEIKSGEYYLVELSESIKLMDFDSIKIQENGIEHPERRLKEINTIKLKPRLYPAIISSSIPNSQGKSKVDGIFILNKPN